MRSNMKLRMAIACHRGGRGRGCYIFLPQEIGTGHRKTALDRKEIAPALPPPSPFHLTVCPHCKYWKLSFIVYCQSRVSKCWVTSRSFSIINTKGVSLLWFSRLVNISSHLGGLAQLSEDLQKKFSSPTLTEENLANLMDQFVK